jgi:Transglutaminase-like superfamily
MPDHAPLSLREKVLLATRVWVRFALVSLRVRRQPLPRLVARLTAVDGGPPRRYHEPATLARAVDRSLRIGSHRPRCLINALVLFRLLREQGDDVELVIGLPEQAADERAHAWVELEGRDVGPPPGRAGHREMARLS